MLIALFILFWIACGILSYGIEYAYWTNEYPICDILPETRKDNRSYCLTWAFGGPITLLSNFFNCKYGKYGIQFSGGPKCKK